MRIVSLLLFAGLSAPAFGIGLQMGHRPEIGAIDAPKTVKPGEAAKLTIKSKNDGSASCGLLVKFGDGTDQQLKMNHEDLKFPLALEHTYKKAGRYTVSASGKEITTHKACKGSASAAVQVGAVKKAAAKKK
jgi:PKD domain-containing protein